MEWSEEYASTISVIDAQHRQLFRLCNELEQELAAGISENELRTMLVHMGEYASRHFTMEEKYMAESGYPGLVEQQETHRRFRERFAELLAEFDREGMKKDIAQTLRRELTDWIHNHVTGLDLEFARYYRALS